MRIALVEPPKRPAAARASILAAAAGLLLAACSSPSSQPAAPSSAPPPAQATAALKITFDENPAPFRSTGCNASIPQGWYTTARIQETGGVDFTPATFVQKLDSNTVSSLTESFGSRFGACPGAAFTPGKITANGSVCGIVGICTSGTYSTYQFQITGTDANGHPVTADSPVLQLGPRPAGQSIGTAAAAQPSGPPARR